MAGGGRSWRDLTCVCKRIFGLCYAIIIESIDSINRDE